LTACTRSHKYVVTTTGQAFDADCYGCLNAKGCYYCPGDATCQNSNEYTSRNKVLSCNKPSDYLQGGNANTNTNTADLCVPPNEAYTADPLQAANQWAYDMIKVLPVWRELGYTGLGIKIRINDDGVDGLFHPEFADRFSKEESCPTWQPLEPLEDNAHGTAVAGIVAGAANNDKCAAGIAYGASLSSCNFFSKPGVVPFRDLAYKLEAFDISQNSIGLPACTAGSTAEDAEFDPTTGAACPFAVPEDALANPCDPAVCDFSASVFSAVCEDAITRHCKAYYRDDVKACLDYNDVILGGGKKVTCDYDALPKAARDALADGILGGREGKGAIYVFASGNSFFEGEDINMSGFTNSRYTITVGAVGKDGKHTDYSTPGAALMVTAPAGDYTDVANLMTAGLGGTCVDSGPGTSFSSPVISGVIALMLEARPELSWRDVQGILANTSQKVVDPKDISATENGAGFWVSNWYGFGIVDAQQAVLTAQTWELWPPEEQAIGVSEGVTQPVPNDGTEFVSTLTVGPEYTGFVAESTVVLINLQHYNRGDLELTLVSPSGTESVLLAGRRPEATQLEGDERWKLMTVRNWGEDPTGKWKLRVRDVVTDDNQTNGDASSTNEFRQWKLTIYGRSGSGENSPNLVNKSSPTGSPSTSPTKIVASSPTATPQNPTTAPVMTSVPTTPTVVNPTAAPVATVVPTTPTVENPTAAPVATSVPTGPTGKDPTVAPVVTSVPTGSTVKNPTDAPVATSVPTGPTVKNPTDAPVPLPTPTNVPTKAPTPAPTQPPTDPPTESPTAPPSKAPTRHPILRPTQIVPRVPNLSQPTPTVVVPAPILRPGPSPIQVVVGPGPAPVRTLPPHLLTTIGNLRRPSTLLQPGPVPVPVVSVSSTSAGQSIASASRFGSLRTMGSDAADSTDHSASFALEEVDHLTLVLEGVSNVPESSWPSLEKTIERHTTSVVSSIFPALQFRSAIEIVSVTPNHQQQSPDDHNIRNLRPARGPSVVVVYNEWAEFERLPGTEHLTATALAAIAFDNSKHRSDFVETCRENSFGDPSLESLIGVSAVGLPDSSSALASASLTETQRTGSTIQRTWNDILIRR